MRCHHRNSPHIVKDHSVAPSDVSFPENAVDFAIKFLKFTPDPAQSALLTTHSPRVILNCCRQWGKSTVTAIKAVHHAVTHPGSLTVIASVAARQSAELVRKIAQFLNVLGVPARGDGHNDISLLLPNGARIVGLPGKDSTMRGFSSVSLLIVDESSRVPDHVYLALRPTLAAAANGQIWLISTPAGR